MIASRAPVSPRLLTAVSKRNPRVFFLSAFIQDDIKVTSRFTLNLGLRWEFDQFPIETNGNFSNFLPSLAQLSAGPIRHGSRRSGGEYRGICGAQQLQRSHSGRRLPQHGALFRSGKAPPGTISRHGSGLPGSRRRATDWSCAAVQDISMTCYTSSATQSSVPLLSHGLRHQRIACCESVQSVGDPAGS